MSSLCFQSYLTFSSPHKLSTVEVKFYLCQFIEICEVMYYILD